MNRIFDARDAISLVYLCKLFSDFGRMDLLDTRCSIDEDWKWSACYDALQSVSDAVWVDYVEAWETQKYYFNDSTMMEYYRLCRAHCRRTGGRLRESPYMKRAAKYVEDLMNLPSGNYGYTLQTKINHSWASGIVVYYDDYFNSHMELIEALLYIFNFYGTELEKLKAELGSGYEKEAA